ncbi:MAG: hypothetical protein K6B70_00720 [Clostridia bacterium]|nr:hypothetical protein [Clostridia bacterium]
MNRKKLLITAIVLILVLAIGGILAYFTDVQTRINKFKTAKVEILVEEPSWPGNPVPNPEYDPDNPKPNVPETIEPEVPVTPGQEIPKDPQVTNKGDGKVYAFVEVVIPVKNVLIGDASTAAPTELFTFVKADGTQGINAGWTQISKTPETISTTTTSVTYVFAYGSATELTELDTNETTVTPVFSKVKFADVTERDFNSESEIQGKSFDVAVKGYGIQVEGISSKVPATVWPNVK